MWDLDAYTCVRVLQGHNKPVQRLTIRGNMLYSTAGRWLRAWDLNTYKCVRNVQTQADGGALRALAMGPSGTIYVAGQARISKEASMHSHVCLPLPHCTCFWSEHGASYTHHQRNSLQQQDQIDVLQDAS